MNPHLPFAACILATSLVFADGPKDNAADQVRPVPPPGIQVADSDRAELEKGAAELGKEIEALRGALKGKPALLDLLPDVQIYQKAVDWALRYNEFYKPQEVEIARDMLKRGLERAKSLREGKAPWTTQTGLIARGYRSKIDGSVQPYGLVVPASYQPGAPRPWRVDFWCHGRGENLTELSFIDGRHKSAGQFTPEGAIVVHLYGRYCCANKFAGEVDLFEALDHLKRNYFVDENRIVVRGFSMGGAACWQFATHYPGKWAAAAPGAGFSETADFLKVFQNEAVAPPWYEKKLWHVYDATDYALNLFNCPTVAYSGEIDRQKQAADMMEKALKAEGMELTHIIRPKTAHAYHPEALKEVAKRIDAIAQHGRNPVPDRIRFTTWTLRYNECLWLELDGLEKHWERARVDAALHRGAQTMQATTTNVSALTFAFGPGLCPLDSTKPIKVTLDGQSLDVAPQQTDRSWSPHFRKTGGKWAIVSSVDDGTPAKRPGRQGPIDDAFMDAFVMVRPTGKPLNDQVGKWTASEMVHATDYWRKQFRAEAPAKDDTSVTDDDIATRNLVLWGDPQSNQLLARILAKLPVQWDAQSVRIGKATFDAAHHAPMMIFPNPLNPKRYVVLNSGFTFREYDYLNNARQVPKLPDYAIVDINQPVTPRVPGGIATAGFFGERWEVLADDGK